MTKTPVELRYNRTTRFLLPVFKLNETILLSMGFKNAYIQDHDYDVRWDLEGCLYLLFNPKKMDEKFEEFCESIRSLEYFRDEYDVDKGVIFVFEIPDKYKSLLGNFIDGKYSKFDKNYIKECIPQFIDGKLSKRWKIFYKDKTLMEELAEEYGYKNVEYASQFFTELEDKPYAEDEIYRYNEQMETFLNKRG